MANGETQARVIVGASAEDEGRVLFDPTWENTISPPFLSWISPSPDGRILALGLCADGSENNTIRLIDVATGKPLSEVPPQLLMDSWLGGVQWLADSSGFFYTALTGSVREFQQAVFFHRLGDPPPRHPEPVPVPASSQDYRAVFVSPCGRWAMAMHRIVTPIPVAVRDLSIPGSEWRPFITAVSGTVAGHVVGNCYIAVTDVDAPRGRVVSIALDSTTANDPTTWREIVSQTDAVIRSVTPVGACLYVTELVDTYHRVRIVDANGSPLGEVPLPGRGALTEMPLPLMNLASRGSADVFVFGFSSLVESPGVYMHRPGADRIETLIEPAARIEGAMVEDHWAVAADGTRVPYHAVRLDRVDTRQPQPTLIYAYGAAGVPLIPQFPGAMAAFVAAGGVFIHAHLRGGGEFGRDWFYAGTLKNRQNSYADLYAIADDLIEKGVTTAGMLGVTGASAGGLMAGVAITQRPDLWAVVIPRVPVMDIIGGCRERYLAFAASLEYGDLSDPDEVRRIAEFSPYHLIHDATAYPAVYVDAGDTDPRCPPWHARKFVARLQAAQAGDAPILLHVWENVGHGGATAKDVQIEESTEWLAFAMQTLGLTPRVLDAKL